MPELEIEGYRILEKVGGGATGDVYKAEQMTIGRVVALKVLPALLSADAKYVERFMNEARALARVRHANIVAAFDAGKSGDHCWLSMEYVKGNTLAHIIDRGGALDEKRVARIGLQMSRALEHAAHHGLVHRDIKPANIIVETNGEAKLCDMGFARLARAQDEDFKSGYTLGTPSYISPEQAKGVDEVGAQSDIYSLGATLYHAATGLPPFGGHSAAEVMMKHITEYVEPPHERDDEVSVEFSFIVKKMMRKNLDKRYRTARALSADLEAFLDGSFEAPANWFSESSLQLRAQGGGEPEPGRPGSRRLRRSRKRRR